MAYLNIILKSVHRIFLVLLNLLHSSAKICILNLVMENNIGNSCCFFFQIFRDTRVNTYTTTK